ncbi:hypothetical protein J5N97_012531 [Dioscorea zingiberensis]|uniref:Polygalacturonase n=1 Tax=Dioscorea zingiberensis TaxID=325984 RepID=A0A9D5HI66_9LILI|nr:hypothetical protein J5N97_012531 [Dioscorea zingiberensis]
MKPSYNHLLLLLFFFLTNSAMCSYNVMDFGAIPDGETDSVEAFLSAWQAVCASEKPASMLVPEGRYLLSPAVFRGPCNNSAIRVFIEGMIVAPFGYSGVKEWVSFKYIDGVSINGGTFDGQGQAFWACKNSRRRCPAGATVCLSPSLPLLYIYMYLYKSIYFWLS